MGKIKVMDELLANKIAAGEVVEKCVSIVKELIENSIDASASEIKIELKEAGIREIKITDDGIGMEEEDALLAFQRHATSKLYNVDDLFNISSLGFRGEALPSIASVSEVILKTCKNDIGTLIHIKGGKLLENSPCEARRGTSIVVKNLFYNTPARLKHLSSIYSELAAITDYVNKMALSYPKVKFKLINDEKEILERLGYLEQQIKSGKDLIKDIYNQHWIENIVVWNKMYAIELFKDIRYPVGKIHEDEYTTYKILYNLDKVAIINKFLHNYRQNENSIIGRSYNVKRLDILEAFEERLRFLEENNDKELYELTLIEYLKKIKECYIMTQKYINQSENIQHDLIKKYKNNYKKTVKNINFKEKLKLLLFYMLPKVYYKIKQSKY